MFHSLFRCCGQLALANVAKSTQATVLKFHSVPSFSHPPINRETSESKQQQKTTQLTHKHAAKSHSQFIVFQYVLYTIIIVFIEFHLILLQNIL